MRGIQLQVRLGHREETKGGEDAPCLSSWRRGRVCGRSWIDFNSPAEKNPFCLNCLFRLSTPLWLDTDGAILRTTCLNSHTVLLRYSQHLKTDQSHTFHMATSIHQTATITSRIQWAPLAFTLSPQNHSLPIQMLSNVCKQRSATKWWALGSGYLNIPPGKCSALYLNVEDAMTRLKPEPRIGSHLV